MMGKGMMIIFRHVIILVRADGFAGREKEKEEANKEREVAIISLLFVCAERGEIFILLPAARPKKGKKRALLCV